MSSRAYKRVFEYLVQNTSIDSPSTVQDISDGSGVSKPSVFRLVQSRANGSSPDETVSPGIFIAPDTMTINGGRAARLFYADPSRIKDAELTQKLVTDRVEIPYAFEDFIVRPVVLTPSVLALMQFERETINTVLDSKKPWPEFLEAIFTGQSEAYANLNKWYSEMSKVFLKVRKNYEEVQNGEATLDKKTAEELHEYVQGLAHTLVAQLELLRTVMQVPQFDSNTARIFSEDTKKPHLAPPVIKERK